MAFYAGQIVSTRRCRILPLIVLTDLRQTTQQAADRDDLRRLLDRPSGA
jgi:hypothetical protein